MIYLSSSGSKALAFIWVITALCISSVISDRDVPALHVTRSDKTIVKAPISEIDEVKEYPSLGWVKLAKQIGVIKAKNHQSTNKNKKSDRKDSTTNGPTEQGRIHRRSPALNYPQSTKFSTRSVESPERKKELQDSTSPEEKARISQSNKRFFGDLLDKWTKEEDENIKKGKNNQSTRYLLNLANNFRISGSNKTISNPESFKTESNDKINHSSEPSNSQGARRKTSADGETLLSTGENNGAQSNTRRENPEETDQNIKDENGQPIPERIPSEPIQQVSSEDDLKEKPIEDKLKTKEKIRSNSENSDGTRNQIETNNGNTHERESNRNDLNEPRKTFQCKALKLRDTAIMTKVAKALKLKPETAPPLWALLRYAQRSGKILPPTWVEDPTIVQLAPPALVFFKESFLEERDLPSIAAVESVGESDICYSFFSPQKQGIDIMMTKADDVKVVVKSI